MENSPRPPFDDEDADIIFRSSDNIEFRLYKVILAKASSVFRTMIQLPQPESSSTLPAPPPVVELTEDAKTLENLLRLCYPIEHPTVASVEDLHNILEAARKYEIPSVTANLRWTIRRMLPKEPLRIYAIAYMLQIEDVAQEAASILLDTPQFHLPSSPPPEFSVLPSIAIYAAHKHRKNCILAALQAVEDEDWAEQGSWIWVTCDMYRNPHLLVGISSGPRKVIVRQWFVVYFDALKTALNECPSGPTMRSFPASAAASEALSIAASCPTCAAKGHKDLTRFSELLADKVDKAVAKAGHCGPIWELGQVRTPVLNRLLGARGRGGMIEVVDRNSDESMPESAPPGRLTTS